MRKISAQARLRQLFYDQDEKRFWLLPSKAANSKIDLDVNQYQSINVRLVCDL